MFDVGNIKEMDRDNGIEASSFDSPFAGMLSTNTTWTYTSLTRLTKSQSLSKTIQRHAKAE